MPNDEGPESQSGQLENGEKRDLIMGLVKFCLMYLVEKNYVLLEQVQQNYWIQFDDDAQLQQQGLLAAVTRDDEGHAMLLVDWARPLSATIWALPHEAIHLAQICKGDLVHQKGRTLWKEQAYTSLDAEHPDYFSSDLQPWEAEAKSLESELRTAMLDKYPDLKSLLPDN